MKQQRHTAPKLSSGPAKHSAIVQIRDVSFSYMAGKQALAALSLDAREGEILGILGPNGSGKSTLFGILGTLLMPRQGSVHIVGTDVLRSPQEARKHIGVVFQSAGLDGKLTVLENLECHGRFYGLSGPLLLGRIQLLLESFSLWERRTELVEALSGGLQRRVDLARGLLHNPRVLLLDEPSTGLDPAARLDFWQVLRRSMKLNPMTVLLTTHLLDEADRCDRLMIMDKGQLVVSGSPGELKKMVGAEILAIVSPKAEVLQKKVRRKFGISGTVTNGEILLDVPNAARILPRIAHAFPTLIESMTIRKPGLEDVFLQKTGHTLSLPEDRMEERR